MSQLLPEVYAEHVQKLALGLEVLDAVRGVRVGQPVHVVQDGEVLGLPRARVERHASCLHALRYQPGVKPTLDLRIFDVLAHFDVMQHALERRAWLELAQRAPGRRYVPRRLRVPIFADPQVADARPSAERVRRPVLYPGAAYDLAANVTGLRGRALKAGKPVRWVRALATLPTSNTVVGHAHGDDRGEFLLLLQPNATAIGDLVNPLTVRVTVHAPIVEPTSVNPDLPKRDPLWDLPLETLPPPGAPDPVSAGETLPAGYAPTAHSSQVLLFELGALRSAEFDLS